MDDAFPLITFSSPFGCAHAQILCGKHTNARNGPADLRQQSAYKIYDEMDTILWETLTGKLGEWLAKVQKNFGVADQFLMEIVHLWPDQ